MKSYRIGILFLTGMLLFAAATPVSAKILKGKPVDSSEVSIKPAQPVVVGPKKIVAVQGFENKVENPDTYWYRNPKLGTGMSDMLVTSLMDTNAFIILEREKLEAVLAEQDLASSGRTTKAGHAKTGLINQAQALITGSVTLFEEGTKAKKGGFGFGMKNFRIGLGGSGGESQVAVDIRLYDTQTSQVLAAETCKGYAKSKGKAITIGLAGTHHGSAIGGDFGGSDFQKTPIGDATRQAITSAVNFIVTKMSDMPWRGRILKVNANGKIYINCGKRENAGIGDTFSVFNLGETFIDPDTGENLGSEESLVGALQIVQVKEKMSIATATAGSQFTKADIIRWKGA
jgi:curli biogenesis system outer membrane secretion channel CsgG